ncbi:hypothetical protein BY996DRAFT_6476711 [Phakopsora pachyrhizi]|nr:hypothetical protein BY996DRAFT_6476711 [Phakopsora pachyrhizi]
MTRKRDRLSELSHLKSLTESKRLKTRFKGKRRATANQWFGPRFAVAIANENFNFTGIEFKTALNRFEAHTSQKAIVKISGALNILAVSAMKIANDIRNDRFMPGLTDLPESLQSARLGLMAGQSTWPEDLDLSNQKEMNGIEGWMDGLDLHPAEMVVEFNDKWLNSRCCLRKFVGQLELSKAINRAGENLKLPMEGMDMVDGGRRWSASTAGMDEMEEAQ